MKYLSLLIILFSVNSFAEDYKSANRLQEGDVISAEVFNDILDRIELTLKSITEADLLGTWDLVQTVCPSGVPGNCSSAGTFTGRQTQVDDLYSQRIDTITFSNDGDGTYSFQQTNYCSLTRSGDINSSCNRKFAIVDGRMIFEGSPSSSAFSIKKISNTRILISEFFNGSASFNIVRLDKKNLAPNPPTDLTATLSSGTVSLSWTASEGGATSYTIKAKTTATGTYSDVTTGNTSTTYSDSLSTGTKWYRIFAVNSDGTSIGSNVVSVTVESSSGSSSSSSSSSSSGSSSSSSSSGSSSSGS